jgi:uncharacterized protein
MEAEVTLVRVYLKETDHGQKKRLVDELFELLHRPEVSGVTVFRGILGFGRRGPAEADLLHLAGDLPIAIEFFASSDAARSTIAALRRCHPDLHIVYWRAAVPLGGDC